MKKMNKLQVLFMVGMLTLTVALGGCSGDKEERGSEPSPSDESSLDSSGEPSMGGSIVVGIPQDLEDSLDPHKAVAAGTKEILFNIYEGLVKPDKDGNLVEAIASGYQISEDGKTYTFTLRDGVKFHNGNPVTVDDVRYSIERCADTTDGAPLVSAYSMIDSVETPDEKTVVIQLKEANTEFLAYMTTAIVPEGYEELDTAPVGTGPFRYISRSPQENIVIEKFADYWGTPAYLDKVEFKIVADADTIVMSLKGGSIDMFSRLTSTQAAELQDGFRIEEGTMNLVQALYLNHDQAPFDNQQVRQAMCYAVNPEEVMMMIADGKGTEIGSSMFPAFGKYYVEELKDVYQQDIDKAKELLAQAGYPNGFEMTITVPSNYQPHIDTAQVLVEQLKQVGIQAKIQMIEWDSWLADVYANREYQSTVVGVDASALTARALLERFTTGNSGNFINYSNPAYDELFAKAAATVDDAEQVKIYKEMETLLTEDAANVYIQDLANLVALNKKYDGYTFYPLYMLDMSTIYQVKES